VPLTRRQYTPPHMHKITAQLKNCPIIMPFRPTAACLPAITHVFPSSRENKVRADTEMLIGHRDSSPTSEDVRQVKRFGW
jgi:hypothetical protein